MKTFGSVFQRFAGNFRFVLNVAGRDGKRADPDFFFDDQNRIYIRVRAALPRPAARGSGGRVLLRGIGINLLAAARFPRFFEIIRVFRAARTGAKHDAARFDCRFISRRVFFRYSRTD